MNVSFVNCSLNLGALKMQSESPELKGNGIPAPVDLAPELIPNEQLKDIKGSLRELIENYREILKDIPMSKGSILEQILNGVISQKEYQALRDWEMQNKPFMDSNGVCSKSMREYAKIYRTSTSIEEFKKKYLEYKAKQDQMFRLGVENKEQRSDSKDQTSQENQPRDGDKTEGEQSKPFAPIQVKSQSKTYTREDIHKSFLLNFLESEKEKGLDVLKLLEKLSRGKGVDMRVWFVFGGKLRMTHS